MMKRINRTVVTILVVILLIAALYPAFSVRVRNEQLRNNIVVSVSYNDLSNYMNKEVVDNILMNYYRAGVRTVTVPEEDAAGMAASGDISYMTYGALRAQFDAESMALAQAIAQQAPGVRFDSRILFANQEETAQFLRDGLCQRRSSEEYAEVSTENGVTAFCIYDGSTDIYNELIAFDEEAIAHLKEMGFEIVLGLRVQNSAEFGYLETLERIIAQHDVKYLQLIQSDDPAEVDETEDQVKAHVNRISDIIGKYDLTVVINENADQLSNKVPFGYEEIFAENNAKVIRAYENPAYNFAKGADISQTLYSLFFNSTIDRHIRFINLAQVAGYQDTYEEMSEVTIEAAQKYISKVTSLGYTVNADPAGADYLVDRAVIYMISAAIMVLLCYLMFVMLTGNKDKKWNLAAYVLALLAAAASYVMPAGLTALYPTAWAVIMPCFCITVVFSFVKHCADKFSAPVLSALVMLGAVALMLAGGIVMCSMLSGMDYYVNNAVFRGVKISLILPIFYGVVAYFFLFMDTKKYLSLACAKNLLTSRIQVYWVLVAGMVAVVGYIYILRSGNVNSISSMEALMRNTLAEWFAARPRTKEFLVGYPCLVLFAYYMKKTNLPLVQLILAAGGSIVIASISNSFCHVFTDALTIYSRTINGMIVGIVVSVAAYLANLLLVKAVKLVYTRVTKL